MEKITIVYDTSFLMQEEVPVSFEVVSEPNRLLIGDEEPTVLLHVIPKQVKEEIFQKIGSVEEQNAERARTLCSKIMGLQNYDEVNLERIIIPRIHEEFLGPKSPVDQKIVGLAYHLLSKTPDSPVYVATNNGGIRSELSFLRSKKGMNIFTPSTKPQLEAWLIERAAAERARRREAHAEEKVEEAEDAKQMGLARSIAFMAICGTIGFAMLQWKRSDLMLSILIGAVGGAAIGYWLSIQGENP